jgi:hypothetical protein
MKLAAVAFLFWIAGVARAATPSTFDSFFQTVAQTQQVRGADLTETETRDLLAIATDYTAKSRALNHSAIVFESRLAQIETPSDDSAARQEAQIKAMERRRAALLADHIQQLKTALGDTRFAALDTFVDQWQKALLAAPRPVAAKK